MVANPWSPRNTHDDTLSVVYLLGSATSVRNRLVLAIDAALSDSTIASAVIEGDWKMILGNVTHSFTTDPIFPNASYGWTGNSKYVTQCPNGKR